MIASITISLGWWLIPAVITVALLALATIEESRSRGGLLAGASYVVALIPVLFVWCLYFGLRLLLQ